MNMRHVSKQTIIHAISRCVPDSTGGGIYTFPLYACPVQAGWPSPAEDYIESSLDMNKLLVKNRPATFLVTVAGDSMTGVGIHDGDTLVVDKSLEAAPGRIVIASLGGEFTVKKMERRGKRIVLASQAEGYPDIDVTERDDSMIWGVVTYVLHPL